MKKSRILSVLLSLLFIFFSVLPAFSANNHENSYSDELLQSEYDNEFNKLHFYFNSNKSTKSNNMMTLTENNSIDNDEYLYIDSQKELGNAVELMESYPEKHDNIEKSVTMTVEFKTNYENTKEFIDFSTERENVKTVEELRDFRKRLATFSKEYHRNETIANLKKLDSFDFDSIELIDYSPFVRLTVDRDKITTDNLVNLAKDNGISNVSFSFNDEKIQNEAATWTRTLKEIGAYSTISNSVYTGAGIKVGVLEVAVCEPTHPNLIGKSVTIDPNYNNDNLTSETKEKDISHANAVTSVIALMAPDAEIYASRNTNNGVSWFIDNGCDVVNCSFSRYHYIENPDGTYEYIDAEYLYYFDGLIDYQIKANYITVVASAGNVVTDNSESSYNPMKQIRSPGLAYNVITVGGLDCTLGLFDYDLEYHDRACYVTTTDRTKPEISALYSINVPNVGLCSGTSFSAPQVTGSIALIMCKYVNSALRPYAVKSMLVSGANETKNFSAINNSYFDNKVGAGVVSLHNMLNSECIKYSGVSNSANCYVFNYSVTLKKNDILQASLNWFAEPDTINQICLISDLDIRVFDSSNNLVCSSSLGNFSNSEFIRYKATTAGTYSIKVYLNGTIHSGIENEPYAFACNIL